MNYSLWPWWYYIALLFWWLPSAIFLLFPPVTTSIFFFPNSCVFRGPSSRPHHLPQLSVVCMAPCLSSAHSSWLRPRWLVLGQAMTCLSERTGVPLIPAELIFFPSCCCPRRSRQGCRAAGQGNAIWSGKENIIPPARQGSEPQHANCAEREHLVSGWQATGSRAGEMAGADVFQIAFVYINCYGITGHITFLAKLEQSTGPLSFLWAIDIWCPMLN